MADINNKRAISTAGFGGVPYGNSVVRHFSLETKASGALVDGDVTAAIGATDKVRLGVLPAGMRLDDALAIVSDAFTATITGDLGFEYVDGVDSTDVPQDADYFLADLNAAAVGRTRANNTAVKPVVLPKDAYLIWTNQVAAHASVGRADFLIYGVDQGPK